MPNKILGSDFMVLQRQGVFVPDKDYDGTQFPDNDIRTDTDIYHFTGEDLFFSVEEEMTGTFVRTAGDTMTGDLVMNASIDIDFSKGNPSLNFKAGSSATTLGKISAYRGSDEAGYVTFQADPDDGTLKLTGNNHKNKLRNWKGSGMKFIDETEFQKPIQLNGEKTTDQKIDVTNTAHGARLTFGGSDRLFWGSTHLSVYKELRMNHHPIKQLKGGEDWHGTFKFKPEKKDDSGITKFQFSRLSDATDNAFGLDIQLTFDSVHGKIRFRDKNETVMQITGGTAGHVEVFRETYYLLDEAGAVPNLVFNKDQTIGDTKSSYIKVLNKATFGIYGYNSNASTSGFTNNIEVKHDQTRVKYLKDPSADGDAVNLKYLKEKLDEFSEIISNLSEAGAPVGAIMALPTKTAPTGWLPCTKKSFDKNQYPKLFAVLGKAETPDLRAAYLGGAEANNTNDGKTWRVINNSVGVYAGYKTGVPSSNTGSSIYTRSDAGSHSHYSGTLVVKTNMQKEAKDGNSGDLNGELTSPDGGRNDLSGNAKKTINVEGSTTSVSNHRHEIDFDAADTRPNTYTVRWYIKHDYPDAYFSGIS